MPNVDIYDFDWTYEHHATLRASRKQIESVLRGHHEARPNPGHHDYRITGTAYDGTRWLVIFDMADKTTARPVTAWQA